MAVLKARENGSGGWVKPTVPKEVLALWPHADTDSNMEGRRSCAGCGVWFAGGRHQGECDYFIVEDKLVDGPGRRRWCLGCALKEAGCGPEEADSDPFEEADGWTEGESLPRPDYACTLRYKGGGADKFWTVEVYGSEMWRHWGRERTRGQVKIDKYGSYPLARGAAEFQVNRKKTDGYYEVTHRPIRHTAGWGGGTEEEEGEEDMMTTTSTMLEKEESVSAVMRRAMEAAERAEKAEKEEDAKKAAEAALRRRQEEIQAAERARKKEEAERAAAEEREREAAEMRARLEAWERARDARCAEFGPIGGLRAPTEPDPTFIVDPALALLPPLL